MVVEINWRNLSDAISYFVDHGFSYIEAPWVVPDEIIMATCPQNRFMVRSDIGNLVGSAEQSFIHLDNQNLLETGRFVACTPCFRNEDEIDEFHQKSFMKVELYVNENPSQEVFDIFLEDMVNFYGTLLNDDEKNDLKIHSVDDSSVDIELYGVEIGSYGFRTFKNKSWIYGTALAVPRFSTALKRVRERDREVINIR
jgi:aspartyl/asparaginyl-tRNA synthetase